MKLSYRNSDVSPWPTGSTKIFGVIGDPIDHSLSPSLLNEAFTHSAIDAVYGALKVTKDNLPRAIEGVRGLGIAGLSVTMPHKESIIQYLDGVTDRAKKLNSVNCVYWDDDRLMGDSTDGPALVQSIEIETQASIEGKSVMVVGTGGAARAIVLALLDARVQEIVVLGRRPEAVERIIDLAMPIARSGALDDLHEIDIIINATSLGMAETSGEGMTAVPAKYLTSRHFVCDIIYFPLVTPLLRAASAVGAQNANGVGMLALQAARAFSIWTGMEPPIEVMLTMARRITANH